MASRWNRVAASRLFSASTREWNSPLSVARIVVEAVLLVGFALAASFWLNPDDPFGLHSQFPWLWVIPSLLALRYGTLDGVLGAALMLIAWFMPSWFASVTPPVFPQQYFLGGLVLVLVCGQFADVWNGRLGRVRAANAYLDERLKALTRDHYLLRLSHERIEQELLVRPVTLRDLLLDMQSASTAPGGVPGGSPLPGGHALLALLGHSCELEDAALHAFIDGALQSAPACSAGEARALNTDDPLLALAMTTRELAHVQAADAATFRSDYLVCAPIVASDRTLLGMLVVRGMRFFALNHENLQLISVLLGYHADALRADQVSRRVLGLRPECPPGFALELVRLHRLRRSARIHSALVAFVLDRDPQAESIHEHLRRMRRPLDCEWTIETPQRRVLLWLLALAGPAVVEETLIGVEQSLRERFGRDFASGRIGVQVVSLSEAEPEWTLDDLLSRSRVPSPQTVVGDTASA